MLTDDEVLAIYDEAGATWFFDYRRGVPGAPHAILTSGLHSDGYVNSTPVLENPRTVEMLARELIVRLESHNALRPLPYAIVGSPYAAITFSFEVARQLGVIHGFAEKNPLHERDALEPKFLWNRFQVPEGKTILQVEELITTLGTVFDVRKAVERGNPYPVFFAPDVACAIFRPATDSAPMALGDLIYLAKRIVKTWPPNACPLCQSGSPALKPKTHWAELTSKVT